MLTNLPSTCLSCVLQGAQDLKLDNAIQSHSRQAHHRLDQKGGQMSPRMSASSSTVSQPAFETDGREKTL